MYSAFKKLEEEKGREEEEEEEKFEGGDFFSFSFWDGHSGLQDGICEQKALFRDNL